MVVHIYSTQGGEKFSYLINETITFYEDTYKLKDIKYQTSYKDSINHIMFSAIIIFENRKNIFPCSIKIKELNEGDIFLFENLFYYVSRIESDNLHCYDIINRKQSSFYNLDGICEYIFNTKMFHLYE
jgi:hypothetical protein